MNGRQGINWQLEYGRGYHEGTKHPNGELFDPRHIYDPRREPRGHKTYPQAKRIDLEAVTPLTRAPALTTLLGVDERSQSSQIPGSMEVASILHYTGGITKRLRFSGVPDPIPFRAAACTGALYHIELYLVCRELPGLPPGAYHYAPDSHALALLQQGDHRRRMLVASGRAPSIQGAPAVLVFSDAYWRNAFKYQAREFRHTFWDSGTMAANALAICAGFGLKASIVLGFADREVGDLLGLGPQPEFPVLLMPVGRVAENMPEAPALGSLPRAEQGNARYQTSYPAITEMQAASSLDGGEAAQLWRNLRLELAVPPPRGKWIQLGSGAAEDLPKDPIETVIQRRGSSRRFQDSSIPLYVLSRCLAVAARPLASDNLGGPLSLNHLYLIINAVDGVPPGAYVFHPQRDGLEQLAPGEFRRHARHLALGQSLAADASAALFFLTDLERVLEHFGNRGYRAVELQASIAAGRVYLAAYAQRIGATGLTFYDDAVTEFFSPHAAGKSVMFLIAIGNPA
jgi:SagB-type dehydrogenase family enzyme